MKRAVLLAAVLALGACSGAPQTGTGPVEIRGKIGPEMTEKVQAALAAGHRDFTINSSNGGFVLSAAIMAGYLNGYQARLTANGPCYSACALLLMGVRDKHATGDADVRVHAASIEHKGEDAKVAQGAANYLAANGVPRDIAQGRGTALNAYRLTPEDLARSGVKP